MFTFTVIFLAQIIGITNGMGAFYRGTSTLPRADYGMAIGYWNNTVSIFGGEDYLDSYIQYDIVRDRFIDNGTNWLGTGRIWGSSGPSTQIDEYLYSIDYYGYRLLRIDLSTHEQIYDFGDSYGNLRSRSRGACLASNVQDGGGYLFIAGAGSSSGYPYYQIFNISSYEFLTGPDMNEYRTSFTCIIHPTTNRLYSIGGLDSDTYESIYVGQNSSNLAAESWIVSPNKLLIQTRGASSIIWNDDIYIIGGYDYYYQTGDNFLDLVQILNINTGIVTQAESLLDYSIMWSATIRVGSIIYVFGGAPFATPTVAHTNKWQYCDLLATRPPTADPTKTPSKSPTIPTINPTFHPTISPTLTTAAPSLYPSQLPTTYAPTVPTTNPSTYAPTSNPIIACYPKYACPDGHMDNKNAYSSQNYEFNSNCPNTCAFIESMVIMGTCECVCIPVAVCTETPTTATPTTATPTTTPTTTAQPTTAQPTTAQPTTAQPTTAQPTTAQPTTAQPTTAQPTTATPTTTTPIPTIPPTTAQPTMPPTTAQPSGSPITLDPTTAQPTDNPITSRPTTLDPTTSNPTTSNPTTSNPTTSNPTTAQPSVSPITLDPTTAQPTDNPITSEPSKTPTTSEPSVSPITLDPTTVQPTDNPITSTPTTLDATTSNPSTSPTTLNPTTSNPTTSPTTLKPTTEQPSTSMPTTSAPTTSEQPSTAPSTMIPTDNVVIMQKVTDDVVDGVSMMDYYVSVLWILLILFL